jgi:hypothetical protein
LAIASKRVAPSKIAVTSSLAFSTDAVQPGSKRAETVDPVGWPSTIHEIFVVCSDSSRARPNPDNSTTGPSPSRTVRLDEK